MPSKDCSVIWALFDADCINSIIADDVILCPWDDVIAAKKFCARTWAFDPVAKITSDETVIAPLLNDALASYVLDILSLEINVMD